MSKDFKFDVILEGDDHPSSFAFDTEAERDDFIMSGCKSKDVLIAHGDKSKSNDSSVIKKSPNMIVVLDGIVASLAEVTKMAIDARLPVAGIIKLMEAQGAIDRSIVYLTDASYKGGAD